MTALYHVFDTLEAATARQAEIDAASGFPCWVQGYTFPEGEPVPVWTEHLESVRAHPGGALFAIAALDTAELGPVEPLDLPPLGAVDAGLDASGVPIEAGGGKVPIEGGGKPAPVEPQILPEPCELDDTWNAGPEPAGG